MATTTDLPLSPAAEHLADAVRLPSRSQQQWRQALREGLPISSFDALADYAALSPQKLGSLLGIPKRTMSRRRSSGQLTSIESDRLYRLAQVISQAVETLGTLDKARRWISTPNLALGGEVPLELLDTTVGAQQVEEILLRLTYGIHS